ncbi:TPA: hypothetical protein HA265_00295 [Candidatus Woesearchaeota archaeon]|nr:hypothetical protein [Candidatus Woesearchaeota archaeon]
MKRVVLVAILISVLVALSACAPQIECKSPNKVIGKECCLDADDDDVCDSDDSSELKAEKTVKRTVAAEEPESSDESDVSDDSPEQEYEYEASEGSDDDPAIDSSYNDKPSVTGSAVADSSSKESPYLPPGSLEPGVYKMNPGETRDWLTINKLFGYRTSRDKGYMDYMIYTVRNHGATKKSYEVEFMFRDGLTKAGTEAMIGKKYTIQDLKPGEKIVMKQSLGIFFPKIEEIKTIELSVYDPRAVPREDFDTMKKSFTPTDIFPDMEIHSYGLED